MLKNIFPVGYSDRHAPDESHNDRKVVITTITKMGTTVRIEIVHILPRIVVACGRFPKCIIGKKNPEILRENQIIPTTASYINQIEKYY